MTGVGAPDFSLHEDDKGVRIERTVPDSQRYVAVVRRVEADTLRGKKASIRFEVKTEGLEEPGGLCLVKAQREKDLAYAGILGFVKQEVAATTKGFISCKLALEVPEGTRYLLYGFSHKGPGKVWIRGGTFAAK